MSVPEKLPSRDSTQLLLNRADLLGHHECFETLH